MTLRITIICHFAEGHYAECHYAECHYAEFHYAECHYAERHVLFIIMLNAIMLSIIMRGLAMLNIEEPTKRVNKLASKFILCCRFHLFLNDNTHIDCPHV